MRSKTIMYNINIFKRITDAKILYFQGGYYSRGLYMQSSNRLFIFTIKTGFHFLGDQLCFAPNGGFVRKK